MMKNFEVMSHIYDGEDFIFIVDYGHLEDTQEIRISEKRLCELCDDLNFIDDYYESRGSYFVTFTHEVKVYGWSGAEVKEESHELSITEFVYHLDDDEKKSIIKNFRE